MSVIVLPSEEDLTKLATIQQLLDEAYDHYFANSDGHCKSDEGHVSLTLGNYFQRKDGKAEINVEVYSYVLGPSRRHYFSTIDEALAAVRQWHTDEME